MNPSHTRHWLLVIEDDIEPFLIGPLDEAELSAEARAHRADDPSEKDGLYALSLDADGHLRVEGFAGATFEP